MPDGSQPEFSQIIVTCEHGGNEIPEQYRHLFLDAGTTLSSHRGWDPGAIELAQTISNTLKAELHSSTVTRLLVDLNRSLGHRRLHSEFLRKLSPQQREALVSEHYTPYRTIVQESIERVTSRGRCLHLSIHSFTPIWKGKTRATEIGLLFDPKRPIEAEFCKNWKRELKKAGPFQSVHFNRPYRGTSDGLTTSLREHYSDEQYAGIELEINQRFVESGGPDWKRLQEQIQGSLAKILIAAT